MLQPQLPSVCIMDDGIARSINLGIIYFMKMMVEWAIMNEIQSIKSVLPFAEW